MTILALGVLAFALFFSDYIEIKTLEGSDAAASVVGADTGGWQPGHLAHKHANTTNMTSYASSSITAATAKSHIELTARNTTTSMQSPNPVPSEEPAVALQAGPGSSPSTEPTTNNDAASMSRSPSMVPSEVPAVAILVEPVPSSHADGEGTTSVVDATDVGSDTASTPNVVDPPIAPEHFVVHPIYDDDLSYRRACAALGNSFLCLTIRYPFEIPLQDPTVTYVKPFQEEFYNQLDLLPLHMIDGVELDYCRYNATVRSSSMTSTIRKCIDFYYNQLTTNTTSTAVACWSRQRLGKGWEFYGIGAKEQQARMHNFFHRQNLFFLGMSPTPPIMASLKALFGGNCQGLTGLLGRGTFGRDPYICSPVGSQVPQTWEELRETETNWTIIMKTSVRPMLEAHHPIVPQLERFREIEADRQPVKMDFTIVSEHPIAHLQTQDKFVNDWDETVRQLDTFVSDFLKEQYNQTRLEASGIEIKRIIAFDGSPQFFPTLSGTYPLDLKEFRSEEGFVSHAGYEGWLPEYGTKCRGFLPPNSNSSIFNGLGREFYEKYGQDMNLYGRTWEFINLVWYNMKHWNGKGGMLDCTHGGALVSNMHKYFLMAMVDDHFDDAAEAAASRRT